MGEDTRLVNIYLKIHHKRSLTMDELGYLAEFDPECFVKTCENVVYNIPETKPIMEPVIEPAAASEPAKEEPVPKPAFGRQEIRQILKNLRRVETDDFPMANVDSEKIKSLLGNLYMELLFPHNDKYTFIDMENGGKHSSFDKKA